MAHVCPLCKLESTLYNRISDYGERLSVNCARCGKFAITRTAVTVAGNKQLNPKLSAWIRDRSEAGAEVPEIDSTTLKEIEGALPEYSVSEKLLILLRAIERKSEFPGHVVKLHPDFDYPLAWASQERELRYLLRSMIERGLLRRVGDPADLAKDPDLYRDPEVVITAAGWEFLDRHARPSVISNQGFVAMSFSDDLKPAYEKGIKPAIEAAGFKPYRVDVQPHIDRIDLKIMTEIKNSRFLVADVTHQRPGVYFEAGYALGLSLPVFWCVRSDDLKNIHFDTRQYNHIVWQAEDDLRNQLHSFVTVIIGKGSAT